ncbi:hypothetical protein EM59_020415 [Vibrio parahaemolyticus]|uniref:hypothetical protein n=1 Tax=Vibrio parahaemolyticus TaxID=670 RepID=UPI0004D7C381|nr:hypothetical protein [Vibrio parahaemolyticus]MBE4049103.1 hypothetical protein [Vibrio parahaemolyticus]MBE4148412.1 hypothetical protein [Vibrio parahaemolyticus]OQU33495.1 hypothetical protein EM59_020415 [Vibrio parahaemolyticus]HBC3459569.1 hypothetical protein [Vibrio parahaemolyticus]HCG7480868.1 hypothetical protein [Vibrio parahaemolyticus]
MSQRSYQSNEPIAKSGRALVISSSVLFLHQIEILKLDKLPFVGASINGDKDTIGILIFLVTTYFLYKFFVYTISNEEYYSRRDELLKFNLSKYFSRLGKKLAQGVKHAVLSGHDKYLDIAIDKLLIPIKSHDPKYTWITRYHLSSFTFSAASDPEADFNAYERCKSKNLASVKINYRFHYTFSESKEDGGYNSSSTSLTYPIPAKDYIRIYQTCALKSYFSLPDFLEQVFPYIIYAGALLSYFLY